MFTQIQEFYIYEFVKNKIVNLHSESFFNSFLNFSQFYKLLLTLFFETSECFSSGHKYYAIFFFFWNKVSSSELLHDTLCHNIRTMADLLKLSRICIAASMNSFAMK